MSAETTNSGNAAIVPRPRDARPSAEGRFVWLASLAIERIVNELGQGQAVFGIAVYVALCRESSRNQNNPRIKASVAKIAGLARLSYRKTFDTLYDLKDKCRLIAIEGQRMEGKKAREENTYVLLTTKPARSAQHAQGVMHKAQKGLCTGVKRSRAENPKDSPLRGERVVKADTESELSPLPDGGRSPAPSEQGSGAGGVKSWRGIE